MKTNTLPETFPPGFLLTITDKGAARVAEVIGQYKLPEGAGLRAGVTEGGCSGLNYDVEVAEEPNPDETVFVLNGTNIFVNAFSAQYISGMTIDWTSSMQESRFVFNNPNATGGCGCGVSFTVK
ncbi:MAG: iron-sulfur cluster assembly accessory protein [Gemmatimonadetes bacterium]|nr:iron-sulfur cluster assembly accessory protein [Gemmatimonadota bacterium]